MLRGSGGSSLINHANKKHKAYPIGPVITAKISVFFNASSVAESLNNSLYHLNENPSVCVLLCLSAFLYTWNYFFQFDLISPTCRKLEIRTCLVEGLFFSH